MNASTMMKNILTSCSKIRINIIADSFVSYQSLPVDAGLELVRPGLQAVGMAVEQFQDHAGRVVFISKCIGLVRIHMHRQGERRADAHDHIGRRSGNRS